MRERGTTGVQTHVRAFRKYLQEAAVPHELVTPHGAPAWQIYPVLGMRRGLGFISRSLDVWWYRHWHSELLQAQLKRVLSDGTPVTVYAQCPLSARAALAARCSPEQKVVMAVHFNRSQAEEWAEKKMISAGGRFSRRIIAMERRVLDEVDGLVYLSQYMQGYLEGEGMVACGKPSLRIPNFCTIPIPMKSQFRQPRDLVSIGTLETRKNQAYLIRVIAELKKQGQFFTLDLIGDGPDRSVLERLARELEVMDRVAFLGFRDQAARLLPSYRVYAHAALMENMPYTLIEALGCGLPVLAGGVGGVPEIVRDGFEGFHWPLDNPVEGAVYAARLLRDEDLYVRLSQQARRRFDENFDTPVVGGRLQRFLCESMHKGPEGESEA
jgi:glycosyltransferase involved in cell wall biosynthesis